MEQSAKNASVMPLGRALTLRDLIASDIARYAAQGQAFQQRKPGLLRRISILSTPSLICCVLYRVAHALHGRGLIRLARATARLNLLVNRILIEPAATIGPGLYIPHPPGVVFRGRAGRNLCLYTKSLIGPLELPPFSVKLDACPHLGDDVTLGANAIVTGPVEIGSRVQIAPGVSLRRSVGSDLAIIASYLHVRSARDGLKELS